MRNIYENYHHSALGSMKFPSVVGSSQFIGFLKVFRIHFFQFVFKKKMYVAVNTRKKCAAVKSSNVWCYWILSKYCFMLCRAILRVDRMMNLTIQVAALIALVALLTARILVCLVINHSRRILMILKNHCHPLIVRAIVADVLWEVLEAESAPVLVLQFTVSRKRLCHHF